jgi:hypothetical protein
MARMTGYQSHHGVRMAGELEALVVDGAVAGEVVVAADARISVREGIVESTRG